MLQAWVVTAFPVAFLIVLFGGGIIFRRRNIDMDGDPPIHRAVFYTSKYLIVALWAAMVATVWGVDLSFVTVPSIFRLASLFLWAAGFALLLAGRFGMGSSFRLGSPQENTRLKVGGLFRFSRNPMYVGVFATLTAVVLDTLNPIFLLIAVFIATVHHKIVLAEEDHLRQVFGKEYIDYCGRVRRYL